MGDKIILDDLEVECIIGIFDWERETKQKVRISFELDCDISRAARTDDIQDTVNYKTISKKIIALVEPSGFFLIETMAEKIAQLCLAHKGVLRAMVTVSKPGAISGSNNVSIQVTRPSQTHRVFLGIGGNIDPERNIPLGVELIRSRFSLVRLSPVYLSEPWGTKESQPDYLNLVAEVNTELDIFGVRGELCWIERTIGRQRTNDKFAPRPMDVDLLLYDNAEGKHADGPLPHPQVLTQQFVYLPMMDIAPDLVIPGEDKPLRDIQPIYDTPGLRIEKVAMDLK
ncbi:MAG: 2-amino-4-hydroxy-6-hydroxymethyldihydropteridine diphosphokinase [Nitrospinota bacterium]|nr:2-amino-4-hydroxy-6-hydroxymethyldihydropteridine diphosphokinase [Nitrospinota bacterium]